MGRPSLLRLLLGLPLLACLAGMEPAGAFNGTFSLDVAMEEPMVKLMDAGGNMTQPKEVEFGECTVTCANSGLFEKEDLGRDDVAWELDASGLHSIIWFATELFLVYHSIACIGIREVILTNGCPGGETKCIVRVEECRGPADCGWGKPISESLASVKIPCIFVPPENRFQYVWKMLIPDQQSLILPNDSAILEVHRDTHPVAFECDTIENEELIASVKYTVYTTTELETRRSKKQSTDVILVFVLITGVIVCVGGVFAIIFIILNWATVKLFWQTKVWRSRDEPSSSSMRTSSGQIPTTETSQISQIENTPHEQVSYHEWNAPQGGGGGEGEGDKGNY